MKITTPHLLGWREWAALPQLGVTRIRCKVDTGARTSALHAYYVEPFERDGLAMVRFGLHPVEKNREIVVHSQARVVDRRKVTDSGGHSEVRYVIKTPVIIGDECWEIEITLTNRDTLSHRMLLGRSAIMGRFQVDPGATHLFGEPSEHAHMHPLNIAPPDEEE